VPAGISCGATCSTSYDAGTTVTLTATPDAGATFAGWGGACTGTASSCSVTMEVAKSVTARFTYPLAVTLAGSGGGGVTSAPAGISCGATCSASYDAGTTVTLVAAPDAISAFTGWSAACTGTGTCTVTMTQARNVTATFTRVTYLLSPTLNGTGGGRVTSSPAGVDCTSGTCPATFPTGTVVTLTATPDATSSFAGWAGVDSAAGSTGTVTMSADRSVTATFTRLTFVLNVTRVGSGTVTSTPAGISCGSTCSASYVAGTPVSLTAVPGGGSVFTGWSGACAGTGTCFLSMSNSKAVTATFSP
jgi:hypothetical protein